MIICLNAVYKLHIIQAIYLLEKKIRQYWYFWTWAQEESQL